MPKNVSEASSTGSGTVSVHSSSSPALMDGTKHGAAGSDTAAAAAEAEWNGPGDMANPHNWPSSKKWTHVVLVALFALVT